MRIDDKIIVKNYKCFDSEGGGFDQILPINVLIGKNNSGKSSLLDLIGFLTHFDENFLNTGRDGNRAEVHIQHPLTDEDISKACQNYHPNIVPGESSYSYAKKFIDTKFTYLIDKVDKNSFVKIDTIIEYDIQKVVLPFMGCLADQLERPSLEKKNFCKITAERNIVPESVNTNMVIQSNGTGATNYVQRILLQSNMDKSLIENELLTELNKIIRPDIEFSRIFVQQLHDNSFEIYFEDLREIPIALSRMVSGVKTIFLVLLNLIIRPLIERK